MTDGAEDRPAEGGPAEGARPDFVLIGAMKAGTSTLSAFLEDHPDIHMVPRREPNFFSHDENWAKGFEWYEALFAPGAAARLRGEGSNHYANVARYPAAPERMAAYRPDLKLIYIVRDPLARLRSEWVQRRADSGDGVAPTLEAALRGDPDSFVARSLYWRNLSAYRAHFPDDRLHVMFLEDLSRDPGAVLGDLTAFLGVSPHRAARTHVNPGGTKTLPSPLYSSVNRLPGMSALKRLMPTGLKRGVRHRLLSQAAPGPAPLPADLRARLLERIGPDARAFLAHCGKPPNFWDLDPRGA